MAQLFKHPTPDLGSGHDHRVVGSIFSDVQKQLSVYFTYFCVDFPGVSNGCMVHTSHVLSK